LPSEAKKQFLGERDRKYNLDSVEDILRVYGYYSLLNMNDLLPWIAKYISKGWDGNANDNLASRNNLTHL